MNKLHAIWNLIQPLLGKKIPLFAQTVSQFSSSKTNWIGAIMILSGIALLYINTENQLGLLLLTNGIGLISIKDAVVKKGI